MGTHNASTLVTLLFLFGFSCNNLIAIARARAFVAPVTFSGSTLSPLYLASNLSFGTPPQPQQLLVSTDAASHSWVKCGGGAPFDPSKSSTFHYTTCSRSLPCYEALLPYTLTGRLAKDVFSLRSTNGSSQGALTAVQAATFACTDADLRGLGFKGVASFTASKAGLPAQLGLSKFAYCLPSSASDAPTPLFLGEGISYLFGGSPVYINISAFLATAKLNVDPKTGYFSIGVKNVSVDLVVPLNLSSPFQLRISSIEPFTKLSSPVYLSLRSLFRAKAAERGIQPAPAQRPFDTCFNASTIGFSRVGPAVPYIELDLEGVAVGSTVAWSVYGFNSVVSVSESILCWAFLDAGVGKPSVLGSFQQQGNLFEFDLLNKKLGFSGVLDFFRTTCSSFNF